MATRPRPHPRLKARKAASPAAVAGEAAVAAGAAVAIVIKLNARRVVPFPL